MQRDINEVNSCIRKDIEKKANGNSKRCRYAEYTSDQRANIGKRGVENGSTRASTHFSVPESTARRLKKEYLQKMVKVYIYICELPKPQFHLFRDCQSSQKEGPFS